jgi:DAACS family dicarboxylate/amino acid:cation (Na+ or H+) symporter
MKGFPLHLKIVLGMLAGVIGGVLVQVTGVDTATIASVNQWIKPIGDIFLRLIFMMVMPLIFCALILGVGELGDIKNLGRIGVRTLIYTVVVSMISVFIGIGMVQLVKPGSDIPDDSRAKLIEQYTDKVETIKKNADAGKNKSFADVIVTMIPKNPMEDMVNAFNPEYKGGGVLAVMFFALMLGIALISLESKKVDAFKDTIEGMYELIMKVIDMAMHVAPYGVAALLFVLISSTGWGVMVALGKYVIVVIAALAIHQFVTYPLLLWFFGGMNPMHFFKSISDVMLTAFSTSSSNATLPTALKAANENLKLPKQVSHFVLTVGSTANQNGTALFEGVTVLFLAQCFQIDLSVTQQISVVLSCIIAGIGTAGVPGGSLPVVAIILVSVGVPAEAIGIIIGVDRLLDMCRTVLNVTGDLTAAVVISNWEKR